MQSGESSETLGVEAYRVVPLGEPIPCRIECLTTSDDLLFVGTHDSKLFAYRIQVDRGEKCDSQSSGRASSPSPSAALMLLQEVADPRRHPVRALTVVGDNNLLALVGDTIVIYYIHREPSRPFQLHEITAIAGLKDTISFHVKKQKGVLSLAALQRRRLTIYEATFAHMEFLLKETVTLPDGVRTFAWLGRSFVLGGRREYFLYHTSSSTSTTLYPTPRSGAMPFVLPMAPVPEVLVTSEGGGMRALLSDGSEVPGDSRVSWSSSPVSICYEHPYVITQHATGPHTVQVRLPLLTTLEESAMKNKNSLLQYIDISKLAKVSQCWWTDYDCPLPTKTTKTDALTRHPIIAADTSNRLFLLARNSIAGQTESLAARKLFAAADLLCQLCPHEVQEDTLKRVVFAGAMHRFLTLGDYAGCFHELNKIEVDPRLIVQLFPGFVRSEDAAACPPLLTTPPTSVVQAALPSLVEYLQSQRIALLLQGQAVLATEALRAQLACIDYALVHAWCTLKDEAALLTLMQTDNWCNVDDTVAVLQKHKQWVALTVFQEAHDRFETAAEELRHLVGAGENEDGVWKALPIDVTQALHSFFTEHSTLTTCEAYLPQSTIQSCVAAMHKDGSLENSITITKTLVGIVTALSFFRRRALPQQQKLFSQHLTWVLGCAPPENGLRIFFSAQNVQQYASALRLLYNYTEMPGGTSKQLLLVTYLHFLFADPRVHLSEETLYEQYYNGLGNLLFAAPPATTAMLSEVARQRYRSRLDEFLRTSSHVNLGAAFQFFNAESIKSQCIPERALIYRRQGAHRSAVEMFLKEADDIAGAKAYASSASSEKDNTAFTALLELLLKPPHGDPRVEEALTILNTCDGVDAALVLPMLPADLSFAQLSGFLLRAFRNAASAYYTSSVDSSILKAKEMVVQETRLREVSRFAVLDDATVCTVCQRKIRPDTVLAVYPNGLLVHQCCLKNEHVCPATHRDFRYDAYSLLEDL